MVHFLYLVKDILSGLFEEEMLDKYLYLFVKKYYTVCRKYTSGIRKKRKKRKVIISMTTIPGRIDSVWVTIESLLRQSYKPDEIILWISMEEFADKEIPVKLQKQQKRGLQIRYCKNIKSYKKIIYTAQQYPNSYVVTVDDDIVYSEKMLKTLVKEYKKHPNCIICNRSHVIKQRRGKVMPYRMWEKYERRKSITTNPSYSNFFTSGAGTLFPIFKMNPILCNEEKFMYLSPTADDVWLNFIAWISELQTVNTSGILGSFISNRECADKGLYIENVTKQKNDEQIQNVLKDLRIDVNKFI